MADFSQEQIDKAGKVYDILQKMERGKSFQLGFKNDPSGSPIGSTGYPTNNGGLFAIPGIERRVFSTIVTPLAGLLNDTPVQPQGYSAPPDPAYGGVDSPLYDTVTGVTAGNGDSFANQPDAPCDDPPIGGLLKACTLTSPYGRYSMATKQMDIRQVGRLVNRGTPTDLTLMNGLTEAMPFINPTGIPFTGQGVLLNAMKQAIMEMGVSLQRLIAPHVYTGNPTNNKANGGAKQITGLELLVNTGNKVDAITGTPCPSMDSDIKAFNYDMVNGTGRDIVEYLDMLFHYLSWNARTMGLDPVTFKIVMRPELFDEIVKVYPIRYYQEALTAMNNYTNGRVMLAANEATDWRDDMRNNLFLPIRGQRVRVVLDSTIPEDNVTTSGSLLAGQYASDIYMLPDTVMGGIPAHFFEFFNLANGQATEIERMLGGQTWTTDAGMFRWFFNHRNGCFQFSLTTEPRQILLMPFLSGRITDVGYQPLQHTRDWNTGSAYFVNGGRQNAGSVQKFYGEWSPTTPVQIS